MKQIDAPRLSGWIGGGGVHSFRRNHMPGIHGVIFKANSKKKAR